MQELLTHYSTHKAFIKNYLKIFSQIDFYIIFVRFLAAFYTKMLVQLVIPLSVYLNFSQEFWQIGFYFLFDRFSKKYFICKQYRLNFRTNITCFIWKCICENSLDTFCPNIIKHLFISLRVHRDFPRIFAKW